MNETNGAYDSIPTVPAPEWLQGRSRNVYSQGGEDGLIEAIGERLGWGVRDRERWCCEVGAGDGVFCSNTRRPIMAGWNALLIERDPARFAVLEARYVDNPRVFCVRADVMEQSLDDILDLVEAPAVIDLLSIDVDGPDYYVWNAMLRHRSTVVLCEYGGNCAPEFIPTMEEALGSRVGAVCQAGGQAIQRLACSKHYMPLIVTAHNVIAVSNDTEIAAELKAEARAHIGETRVDTGAVAIVTDAPIRLNLGSGAARLDGYVNLDIKDGTPACPLTQYADDSVDEVRASHLLEHYSHTQVAHVVREWVRVLKPGGVLKVGVPDFGIIARKHAIGDAAIEWNMQAVTMGGHVDNEDVHHCIFDAPLLRNLLESCGLCEVQKFAPDAPDTVCHPASLNMLGYKWPVEDGAIARDVYAIISCGRLTFTDNGFSIVNACQTHGIPIERMSGAFWNQSMEILMSKHQDRKYLLTIDHDTVFTTRDVMTLYRLMERHPDIDAAFGVQMKRENDHPLFVALDEAGNVRKDFELSEFASPTLDCASGHFGLTMIRTEKLGLLPHPWLVSTPGPDGMWGPEAIDADINFWRSWHKAGARIVQANHVILGHIEMVVTWPKRDLHGQHQYIGKYNDEGRPPSAWIAE